jgi:hypothetical protein
LPAAKNEENGNRDRKVERRGEAAQPYQAIYVL